jgi:hypothetical protein
MRVAWARFLIASSEITLLAKTNYSFEKRQRELAKKKQQDAKQAKKKAAREGQKPMDQDASDRQP